MITDQPDLWGLFISAFISSSLLPGASEAVLGWLLLSTQHAAWLLVGIASLGNSLGAMTSWGVGRFAAGRLGEGFANRHATTIARLQRHGAPVLLLSWLPVVGDALCVAAGWLRIDWRVALFAIAIGKIARYTVIALMVTAY